MAGPAAVETPATTTTEAPGAADEPAPGFTFPLAEAADPVEGNAKGGNAKGNVGATGRAARAGRAGRAGRATPVCEGAIGIALREGRSRAVGAAAAPAGLADVVLGFKAAEKISPPTLVIEATVKVMSLRRSLAIGGNSTAEL